MSELEAQFLISSLALFRNVEDFGKAKPRANVNLARAYTAADFYSAVFGADHLLHLIGHANGQCLDVGTGKKKVRAQDLAKRALRGGLAVPEIIVSTGCCVQGSEWQDAFRASGAKILIASEQTVTPANLAAFDMAFYAALLSQVRKGNDLTTRVIESFGLADDYYRSIHAVGTPFAKFRLVCL